MHRQLARTPRLQPLGCALGMILCASPVHAQGTSPGKRAVQESAPQLATVKVTAALDQVRNQLSPSTGSSLYVFTPQALKALPLGRSTPLNEVLLQAPGVVRDSFGQLHIRGNMANIQYRINGVILPESIAGFGQTLDTRIIKSVGLLDGALPAQYGLRTAGVISIDTRSGAQLGNGGSVGVTTGSNGHIAPFLDVHGHSGRWSWFFSGNYLRDNLGISAPTAARHTPHDRTWQSNGFGDLSYLINDHARISLLAGVSNNRFQIPPNPGQPALYQLAGVSSYPSADINENQNELTRFAVLSLQGKLGNTDYQISAGQRYSQVNYLPDPIGDLMYLGVAATVMRSNRADTLQADFATPLGLRNTLRYGFFGDFQRGVQDNTARVFAADAAGNQTGDVPFTLLDNHVLLARTTSVYVQDQWNASDWLTLNGGLRYDRISGFLDESQLSPRLGLVYQLDNQWTLHAGYARYFSPPAPGLITSTDLAEFAGTTNQQPGNSNTDVRAMRENYYDAGVQWAPDANLTLGLDAYYSQSRDTLDVGQFGTALIFADFNYGYGRNHGVEFTASWRHGPLHAYLNAALDLARAKVIASGQYNFSPAEVSYIADHWILLDHAPRLTGSGGLDYRLATGTTAGFDFMYSSGLRAGFADTLTMPGWFQLDLSVGQRFDPPDLGTLHARLALVNALDRVIELRNGTGLGVGLAPQYAQRRGVYLTLRKNF
ncbi:TonB-dependent receptor [Metallibacterium sp.]|uniref:TonB-dependent receptor n=1 Tax=Metallibacterium sp. TaxID=2940281 RepID=UPI00260FDBD5|nr:TonB-dependent receptor [Metallibacterium sp.]